MRGRNVRAPSASMHCGSWLLGIECCTIAVKPFCPSRTLTYPAASRTYTAASLATELGGAERQSDFLLPIHQGLPLPAHCRKGLGRRGLTHCDQAGTHP